MAVDVGVNAAAAVAGFAAGFVVVVAWGVVVLVGFAAAGFAVVAAGLAGPVVVFAACGAALVLTPVTRAVSERRAAATQMPVTVETIV